MSAPEPPFRAPGRGRITAEVLIVLALSLGQSAIYSIVQFIDHLTQGPLRDQATALNPNLSDRQIFDAVYQILGSAFGLGSVVLVCFLLWRSSPPHLSRLGIDGGRPLADAGLGVVLAVVIGAGGILVYVAGLALGWTVRVEAAPALQYWWSAPVLVLSAFRAGASEEVVVVGYLFARLSDLGWSRWTIILSSAVLRGSYHLYQGVSAFIGNAIMGVIFGWLYTRTKRVLPLVIAHTLIDAAVFIGYPWASATFPHLFGR